MQDIRRIDVTWQGKDAAQFDAAAKAAKAQKQELPEYVKEAIKKANEGKK